MLTTDETIHQSFRLPESVTDPFVPDPKTAGQERNVFGRAGGHEFAYSESNPQPVTAAYVPKRSKVGEPLRLLMFNRNPGKADSTCGDNPAMNRGVTIEIDEPEATVRFIDESGANQCVTAVVDLGTHVAGRSYTFGFHDWHGDPPAD